MWVRPSALCLAHVRQPVCGVMPWELVGRHLRRVPGGDSGVSAGQWEEDTWPWEEEPGGAGTGDEGHAPECWHSSSHLPASLAGPAQGLR